MFHEEVEESRWHDDGGAIRGEMILGVNLTAKPSGTGCLECLESGKGWWLHLRRCAECGHVGCCDNSPKKHATAHYHTSDHPIIQSFEPGEDWFYDYREPNKEPIFNGSITLAKPHSHPKNQAVPFTVPLEAQRKAA